MSEITKKALGTSIKKLLMKSELSNITIKDITDDCGVNRQTFYYHFKDVYDLIEWVFINEVIEEIKEDDTYESWQQGFLYIFNYVQTNKKFIINTYNSISRDYIMKFLYKQTNMLLINVINEKSKNIKIKEDDKKNIADFYKYGFVGTIEQWIANGMKEDPEKIVQKLNIIIEGNFEKAINALQI